MNEFDSVNLSFRLNLNHDEENDIWQAIRRVDEDDNAKFLYGSKSGFIKQMLAEAIHERKCKSEIEEDCQKIKEEFWDKLMQDSLARQKESNDKLQEEIADRIDKAVSVAVQNAMGSLILGMQLAGSGVVTSANAMPINSVQANAIEQGKDSEREKLNEQNQNGEELPTEDDFFKPDVKIPKEVASFLDVYGD